ncbi:MAG: hypothetical protein KAI83_18540, partial [Thiomargarita sp.]|nr:hypothetical protein [Thiomargarita sp.]
DGRSITFKDIVAEQKMGKEHFCYTIRHDGTIGLERIINARMTKTNAKVIKVTLDNGETIICTPDHPFMLRDGRYKPAELLTSEESLMPLYCQLSDKKQPGITIDGYEMVWDPRSERWLFTHILADWYNRWQADKQTGKLRNNDNSEKARETLSRNKYLRRFDKFCERYFEGNESRASEAVLNYNHRIVSIEHLTEPMDVYDIEVPQTHNFALASGVFVHNSAKQGRDRKYQAILPLKGKILNVEKARFDKMLASVEVGNLITALGCGIGNEEYEPDNLRYHRVILATDADVDGQHIRTLLLTFFYRQMPELIERGHIYIAQPPLYKLTKGKQEQYVKDDIALDGHLMTLALQNAQLFVNPEAPPLNGEALETLFQHYQRVMAMIERISRQIPADVLETMIDLPPLNGTDLDEQTQVQQWFDNLAKGLENAEHRYHVQLLPEEDSFVVHITMIAHGVEHLYAIKKKFFNTAEYQALVKLGETLRGLLETEAYIARGEKKQPVSHFKEVVNWLMAEARRGLHIQRYKGLGEMNPDQLWETTMNIETRNLLQVQIEDAVACDEIFTTLMGDQVEPRRDFIEKNALSVVNLDT